MVTADAAGATSGMGVGIAGTGGSAVTAGMVGAALVSVGNAGGMVFGARGATGGAGGIMNGGKLLFMPFMGCIPTGATGRG